MTLLLATVLLGAYKRAIQTSKDAELYIPKLRNLLVHPWASADVHGIEKCIDRQLLTWVGYGLSFTLTDMVIVDWRDMIIQELKEIYAQWYSNG